LTDTALGSMGVVSGFLSKIELSQVSVLYANRPFTGQLFPQDPGPTTIGDRISFMARLGTTDAYTDIALPPPPPAAGDTAPPSRPSTADKPAGTGDRPPATGDRPATTAEKPAQTDGLRFWLPVQKSFGPLQVRRIGGQWKDGKLGFLLDAGVELLGLAVGLSGLRVSVPFSDLKLQNLEFGLDGLDLAYQQGPIEIAGGFLLDQNPGPEFAGPVFSGLARIKAEQFTLAALGSYGMLKTGNPSLFIYAYYAGVPFGPACLQVQGIAAGFGYNRALKIPEIEKVQDFPLVQAVMQPEKWRDLRAIFTAVAEYIPPAPGQYWLAIGVRFTSFQMIDSFALLAVSFGTEIVITGLGLSRLTVPPALPGAGKAGGQGAPIQTIALVEVALKIVVRPESGILSAEARLTPNSYVFSKDCKLTGGFAFYLWFKDVRVPGKSTPIPAGDFVITLGGYHPRFTPPDHYPVVPRLGLNWQISPSLRVAGEVYFALTPTCLMAGGRLSALFQEGDLRAWFDAYAHFFIAWKPVQYEIEAGVRIGVSYRLSLGEISDTFTIEMSAAVHLWGPPFAGKAEINWTIISFTVYFGESREKPAPPALEWSEFGTSFLPSGSDPDPLTIAVVRGVISEVKPSPKGEQGYLIVNPYQAVVMIKSAVPSTSLAVNGDPPLTGKAALGIRPMGITELEASCTEVEVVRRDVAASPTEADRRRDANAAVPTGEPIHLKAEAIKQNVPEALWGRTPFDPKADQKVELIEGVLTGVQLTPPAPGQVNEYEIKDFDKRYDRPDRGHLPWKYRYAPSGQRYEPERVIGHLTTCRTDATPQGQDVGPVRRGLLEALAGRGLIESAPPEVDDAYRLMQFQAPPVECGLGMLPAYPADRP
jgi:hypothetical protein